MRRFTDLNTHIKDPHSYLFAAQLGFSRIASEYLHEHSSLDVVSRLNITPKSPNLLLQQLKKNRFNYEIISVVCYNKAVARQAGRDHRVDVIKFPLNSKLRFDHHQANLMKDTGSALQIDTLDLLERDPLRLEKNIQRLCKQIFVADKRNIPVILSSGAYEKYQLREPRGIMALASLMEIDEESSEEMITKIPNGLVDKNRAKLSDKFVMPDVWLF